MQTIVQGTFEELPLGSPDFLGKLGSKVRTGADKLSDMGAAFAGDAADAIEKHNAFDARPLSNSSSRAPSRRGSTARSQVPRWCGSSIRRTRPPSRGCSRSRASPRLRDA